MSHFAHRPRHLGRVALFSAVMTGPLAMPVAAQENVERTVLVEEVIVTAQKREQDIQDVPVSISVMGGGQIEELSVKQLSDYASYVPGLMVATDGGPGRNVITLRGLFVGGATAMVGTYIDEAPFGSSGGWLRGASHGLDLMPYELERIEVLRGPQGTLYGANSMGGLLKYVTRSPDLNHSQIRVGADTSSTQGSEDIGWGGRMSANVPLIDGELGLRVSLYQQNTPGYIDNVLSGVEDENEVVQEGGRATLLWAPGNALSLKLSALLQKIESDGPAQIMVDASGQPLFAELRNAHAAPITYEQEIQHFSAILEWDLGWGQFTSASSYATSDSVERTDGTAVYGILIPVLTGGAIAAGLAPFGLDLELTKFTQEVRLASSAEGRIEWMLGLFYTAEDGDNQQRIGAQFLNGAPIPGLDPFTAIRLPSNYDEYAAFANVTWKLTERFDVSAGLRWSNNDQDFEQIVSDGLLLPIATTPGEATEEVVTYAFSPRYHFNDDVMGYLRVASGYRPGAPNSALPGVPKQVNSDSIVNYEAGLKSEFLDRRVLLDLAVFYVDWDDIQITVSEGGFNFGRNGGTARSQGLELTAGYSPVQGLRLGVNAAYTDAELTQDVAALGGTSGARLPMSPKWNAAATADYAFGLGEWDAHVGGGYRYVGERLNTVSSHPLAMSMDSYGVLDLNAGVSGERWSVKLFARNLTNEHAYLSMQRVASVFGDFAFGFAGLAEPRTIGVGVDLTF